MLGRRIRTADVGQGPRACRSCCSKCTSEFPFSTRDEVFSQPLQLTQLIDPAGSSEVEEAAHVLKSTSAMVGGASLAALAARIESSARDGALPTDNERGELRALASETEGGIRSIVARLEVGL